MIRRAALTLILTAFAAASSLHAKDPSLAVITEDLSGEVGDGGIEMVESLAESGISRAPGVSLADLGTASVTVDWCSMRHERQYTRLFRS